MARKIRVPENSTVTAEAYARFLREACGLLRRHPQYLCGAEDENCLELAHLYPAAEETVIAIYVGINDAVCHKGLVSPFLIRHAHNNVFAFDPERFSGGDDVPSGTVDAAEVLNGFEPPNATWNPAWTYVMIADPRRSADSLWREPGYRDMIPAKQEDFTMLSDPARSSICFFIDPGAFAHPVNRARTYLSAARDRGAALADEFRIPDTLRGETDGLEPVALGRGEKLYVARPDFGPCAHAWSNLHANNSEWAVVSENSAVPLDLAMAKPPANVRFHSAPAPPHGSADMTTDWFWRGKSVYRQPLLQGLFPG